MSRWEKHKRTPEVGDRAWRPVDTQQMERGPLRRHTTPHPVGALWAWRAKVKSGMRNPDTVRYPGAVPLGMTAVVTLNETIPGHRQGQVTLSSRDKVKSAGQSEERCRPQRIRPGPSPESHRCEQPSQELSACVCPPCATGRDPGQQNHGHGLLCPKFPVCRTGCTNGTCLSRGPWGDDGLT